MNKLAWIDLEMTGLDPLAETIIEIASVVTDTKLNILAIGPNIAIKADPDLLFNMDNWNQTQHTKSGLLARVKQSTYTLAKAEQETLEFLASYLKPEESPLCGNSVSHDRSFLKVHMPKLAKFFHYRHLDVSSIKILANCWYQDVAKLHKKSSAHLALDDIKDSINELKFYKEHIFK